MSILREIGLDENSPSEIVLATFDEGGVPNASAVGVWKNGSERVKLRLFAGSQTYRNVKDRKAGTINILSDSLFLIKRGLPEIFPVEGREIEFKNAGNVDAPYLAEADCVVEFEVVKISERIVKDRIGTSKMAEVIGSVENVDIRNENPRPFRRTDFYLIESAVLATRAIEARRNCRDDVFEDLIEELKFFKEKCGKIAAKSREMEAIIRISDYFKDIEAEDF